jgi:hypothetical protein
MVKSAGPAFHSPMHRGKNQTTNETIMNLFSKRAAIDEQTMAEMETTDRVRAQTAAQINDDIDRRAGRRLVRAAGAPPAALSRLIADLDEEWDIERWLETNASAVALTGTVLGLFVNKKFLLLPCLVLPFLLQHAIQGWCPPVPLLRRKGVRTRREIDAEKYALKALRGDFSALKRNGEPAEEARAAWKATKA